MDDTERRYLVVVVGMLVGPDTEGLRGHFRKFLAELRRKEGLA